MATQKQVTLTVNGRRQEIGLPAHRTLLEVLRDLGHVEVKCGCEKGDCGACAVLVDGEAVNACVTLAWQADGTAVTTVRGLAKPGEDHPLHTAFIQTGAVQCGYCIPGMIVAAKALLDEHPDPTDEEIRRGLSGNLCRCTGYVQIFAAVRSAAAALRGEGGTP